VTENANAIHQPVQRFEYQFLFCDATVVLFYCFHSGAERVIGQKPIYFSDGCFHAGLTLSLSAFHGYSQAILCLAQRLLARESSTRNE